MAIESHEHICEVTYKTEKANEHSANEGGAVKTTEI